MSPRVAPPGYWLSAGGRPGRPGRPGWPLRMRQVAVGSAACSIS